jgi:hypothetical protein
MIFYLGDIHGNFNLINQYIKMYDLKDAHIIQVGDFGVGFNTFEKEKRLLQMTHDVLVKNNIMAGGMVLRRATGNQKHVHKNRGVLQHVIIIMVLVLSSHHHHYPHHTITIIIVIVMVRVPS